MVGQKTNWKIPQKDKNYVYNTHQKDEKVAIPFLYFILSPLPPAPGSGTGGGGGNCGDGRDEGGERVPGEAGGAG